MYALGVHVCGVPGALLCWLQACTWSPCVWDVLGAVKKVWVVVIAGVRALARLQQALVPCGCALHVALVASRGVFRAACVAALEVQAQFRVLATTLCWLLAGGMSVQL